MTTVILTYCLVQSLAVVAVVILVTPLLYISFYRSSGFIWVSITRNTTVYQSLVVRSVYLFTDLKRNGTVAKSSTPRRPCKKKMLVLDHLVNQLHCRVSNQEISIIILPFRV